MKGWVQVLTPARPAWGTFASLGFATLPAVGAADVLDAGLRPDRRGRHGRAAGLPDGAARGAGAGALVADRAGGLRRAWRSGRPPEPGSRRRPRRGSSTVSRAGTAAWPVGQLGRKSHQLHCTPGTAGKAASGSSPAAIASVAAVMSTAMSSARRHVVGQRPLGVLEGGHRAAGQVVQLHPAARTAQRAADGEHVERPGPGEPRASSSVHGRGRSCSRRRPARRRARRSGRPGRTASCARSWC